MESSFLSWALADSSDRKDGMAVEGTVRPGLGCSVASGFGGTFSGLGKCNTVLYRMVDRRLESFGIIWMRSVLKLGTLIGFLCLVFK